MSYTQLSTKGSGDDFDYTDWNLIAANFEAGVPAIMTAKGDIAVASTAGDAGVLAVGDDYEILQARAGATLGVEWSAAIGVQVESTTQTIPTATDTAITSFTSEIFDTNDFHDNSTNPERLSTTASGIAGVYLIGCSGVFASNATGVRYISIQGTVTSLYITQVPNSGPTRMSLSTIRVLDSSDYITMNVYQSSGGNLAITDLQFWMMRLR